MLMDGINETKLPQLRVSAAILRRGGKILICRRAEGGSCPLLWEFPGGKQEPGETPEQCVIRECREELGVEIAPRGVFREFSYRYPEREIAFTFFTAEIARGEIRRIVHKELRWAAPRELTRFDFCPADKGIVEEIAKGE